MSKATLVSSIFLGFTTAPLAHAEDATYWGRTAAMTPDDFCQQHSLYAEERLACHQFAEDKTFQPKGLDFCLSHSVYAESRFACLKTIADKSYRFQDYDFCLSFSAYDTERLSCLSSSRPTTAPTESEVGLYQTKVYPTESAAWVATLSSLKAVCASYSYYEILSPDWRHGECGWQPGGYACAVDYRCSDRPH